MTKPPPGTPEPKGPPRLDAYGRGMSEWYPRNPTFSRPVILPPGPRTSRSFVLAAARLRALHLDPLRQPAAPGSYARTTGSLTAAPVFIERFSYLDPRSSEVRTSAAAAIAPMRCGQRVTRSRAGRRHSRRSGG